MTKTSKHPMTARVWKWRIHAILETVSLVRTPDGAEAMFWWVGIDSIDLEYGYIYLATREIVACYEYHEDLAGPLDEEEFQTEDGYTHFIESFQWCKRELMFPSFFEEVHDA